jgi:hypothetical protein
MIASSEVFAQHRELRLTVRAQAAGSVPAGENADAGMRGAIPRPVR